MDASKRTAVSYVGCVLNSGAGNLSMQLRHRGLWVSFDFLHKVVTNEALEL